MRARRVGALVGVMVGLGADVVAGAVLFVALLVIGPSAAAGIPSAIVLAVVTCITGGMSGWLAGPWGWSDPNRLSNTIVIIRMAVLAAVIGALLCGSALAIGMAPLGATSAVDALLRLVFFGPLFAIWGIVLFGLPVLPITATAAGAWIVGMSSLKGRLDVPERPSPPRPAHPFLVGLVLGAVDGFLGFEFPVLAFVLVQVAGILFAWYGVGLRGVGGLLTGAGALWIVVLVRAAFACGRLDAQATGGCWSLDLTPYVLGAGLALATGLFLGSVGRGRVG
jgi:hypothetical protein